MELEIIFNMILVYSIIWSIGTNLYDGINKTNTSKIS